MENNNKIRLTMKSLSENEALARSVVACFALRLNPTLADVSDVKTAVSEAVTNCIVHGYPGRVGDVEIEAEIIGSDLHINVFDHGVGIEDLDEAMQPFFTTREKEERSGMGFTIMKSFMDEVKVESQKGLGTRVYMLKKIKADA